MAGQRICPGFFPHHVLHLELNKQLGSCCTNKLWYQCLVLVWVSGVHFQLTTFVLSLSLKPDSSKIFFSQLSPSWGLPLQLALPSLLCGIMCYYFHTNACLNGCKPNHLCVCLIYNIGTAASEKNAKITSITTGRTIKTSLMSCKQPQCQVLCYPSKQTPMPEFSWMPPVLGLMLLQAGMYHWQSRHCNMTINLFLWSAPDEDNSLRAALNQRPMALL